MSNKARYRGLVAATLTLSMAIAGCTTVGAADSDVAADTGVEPTSEVAAQSSDASTATTVEASGSEETQAAATENQESHASADDLAYDESDIVTISLDGSGTSSDSGDVVIAGSTVTITAEGVYSLSGSLSDGEIIVEASDDADVILILDGVNITNADGAAIAVMNAGEAIVILAEGTTNWLIDGATYTFPDQETDEPNAALYSAADLTIAGTGELIVDANYNDGIASKDGLVIESGTLVVSAADDGIRGKDYVIVNGGAITVEAGGDGIKSDNDEDAERGYVLITDGVVNVASGDDGVQAATDILLTGGWLTVDAGRDSDDGRGVLGDVMVVISGGVIDVAATDDALHSNNMITIDGGDLALASGDDGIHADLLVTVNGGSITITGSYEGIEAEVIEINDGFIDITSSDDGLNATGADTATAAEASATDATAVEAQNRDRGPGGGGAAGDYYVYINGGTIVITITGDLNEQGDGIDSNGYLEMTGGVLVINGPTDTRNSALDYNGNFEMSGGLIIGTNVDGVHSSGLGDGSTQASLYLTSDSIIDGGTVVNIETMDGESLITYETVNDFSVIVFSSPDLIDGDQYEVYLGGTVTGDSSTGLYEDSAYSSGDLAGTVTASL